MMQEIKEESKKNIQNLARYRISYHIQDICQICCRQFFTKGLIDTHMVNVHQGGEVVQNKPVPNQEQWLTKSLRGKSNIPNKMEKYSIANYEVKNTCNICSRQFFQEGSHELHMRIIHNKMKN